MLFESGFSHVHRYVEELLSAVYIKSVRDQIPFKVKRKVFEQVVNFYSCTVNNDLDSLLLYWLRVKKSHMTNWIINLMYGLL